MSFRRGACPALSAPMQTGDGLLVRLATAGASLTPQQLIALCTAAERHGNGLVEITARGNFQIRGLTPESAAALASDIAAMKLGLRDGLPVETNPLAGLDPTETADAAPLAEAIRNAIDETDLKGRLAPKVSVVVDGGGSISLSDVAADIRFDAVTASDWLISIGGDASSASPLGICDAADATAIAIRLLDLIASTGPGARARDLTPSEMKALAAKLRLSPPPPSPEPVLGPGPGRTQGVVPLPRFAGEDRRSRTIAAPGLPPFTGEGDHAKRGEGGGIALTSGHIALPVALPFGSILAGELAAFLDAAIAHGVTELRLAPGRSLILICAANASAMNVREAARAASLIVDDGDPRTRIFACPGSDGCASGHFPAREIAAAVASKLDGIRDANFSLHISGCAKGCAHPAATSLTLVGTEDGPMLVENGTARHSGIQIGNQDVVARLVAALQSRANDHSQSETGREPHPAHAFAGD